MLAQPVTASKLQLFGPVETRSAVPRVEGDRSVSKSTCFALFPKNAANIVADRHENINLLCTEVSYSLEIAAHVVFVKFVG